MSATLLIQVKNACTFHNLNSHNSMNCRKLDMEQKISKLKSENLCSACFKSKYLIRYCKSGSIYKISSSKFHNKSVCKKISEL